MRSRQGATAPARAPESTSRDPFRRSLPALVARESWFEDNRFKVLRAHMPFSIPMHEDRGTMHVEKRGMRFEGDRGLSLDIAFGDIVDVHLGFDERYRKRYEQAFGLFTKPLRITHVTNGKTEDVYVYLGFRFAGRQSENAKWHQWFEKMRPS